MSFYLGSFNDHCFICIYFLAHEESQACLFYRRTVCVPCDWQIRKHMVVKQSSDNSNIKICAVE